MSNDTEAVMPPPPATPALATGRVHDVPTPDTNDAKRKRQPRNSACQPCASLKMKCISGPDGAKCERCDRMNRDCLPSVPRPRKRRPESENNIFQHPGTAILDAVPESKPAAVRHANPLPSPPLRTPASMQAASGGVPVNSLLSNNDLYHTSSRSFSALLGQGLRFDTLTISASELLYGIDANALRSACTVFRQYTACFPFVTVPMRIDAVSMALERPLTALAMCLVTSSAEPELHDRLNYAFRLALLTKVLVQAERGIDTLTGLLVYLTWSHHYQAQPQLYQYLGLLAGMASDMEKDGQSSPSISREPMSLEWKRAIVGSYYLCSVVAVTGLARSSCMQWADSLRTHAETVARARETATDQLIVPMLEMARAINDLQHTLHGQTGTPAQNQLLATMASNRWTSLKREHPQLTGISFLNEHPGFAGILVFLSTLSEIQYRQSEYGYSGEGASAFAECALTVKEYFDKVLSRPPAFFHQMSFADWTSLQRVLVLLLDMTRLNNKAPGWVADSLMSMLQPEQTMDRLYMHMASAPSGDPLTPRNPGLLRKFRDLLDLLRRASVPSASATAPAQEGRFRPANEDNLAMTDRPLPYQTNEPSTRAESQTRYGVLEDEFWRRLIDR